MFYADLTRLGFYTYSQYVFLTVFKKDLVVVDDVIRIIII